MISGSSKTSYNITCLAAAEATKNKDMLLKVWAEQVRDLSYSIEDCLDEFMVHVRSQSLSKQLMKLKDRRRIAIQIRNLKSRVEEVSSRNIRYNLIKTEASTIAEMDSYTEDVRSHSANNIDEAELVGFSKTKEELVQLMDVNTGDGHAKVICVVGMGGLGKTTLARKVYESKEYIWKKFSCCAWVTVSQSFSKIEMIKDMIIQLRGGDSLKKCLDELEGKAVQAEDLGKCLAKWLQFSSGNHGIEDVQGSNTAQLEEATEESSHLPEPAAAAESSSQVVVMPTANVSEDHGQGHFEGSTVVEDDEDDFGSCISDDQDAC